jgi:hypothetical protein
MTYIARKLLVLVNMRRITQDHYDQLLAEAEIAYVPWAREHNWNGLFFQEKVEKIRIFWRSRWNDKSIQSWVKLAGICMLHQPSSCSVERLFSVLKCVLTENGQNSLDDYVIARVYKRYDTIFSHKRKEFAEAHRIQVEEDEEDEEDFEDEIFNGEHML